VFYPRGRSRPTGADTVPDVTVTAHAFVTLLQDFRLSRFTPRRATRVPSGEGSVVWANAGILADVVIGKDVSIFAVPNRAGRTSTAPHRLDTFLRPTARRETCVCRSGRCTDKAPQVNRPGPALHYPAADHRGRRRDRRWVLLYGDHRHWRTSGTESRDAGRAELLRGAAGRRLHQTAGTRCSPRSPAP
jgi:hypothetical protein